MTDGTIASSDKNKMIVESKLHTLTSETQLLEFLVPDIGVQAGTEAEINENFPRLDTDEDHTRILINYKNVKDNAMLFNILDMDRYNRKFDIDHFLSGYMKAINIEAEGDDPIKNINLAVLAAINISLNTALELSDEKPKEAAKALATEVLISLICLIYRDPLDIVIALNENPPKDEESESESVIVAMWVVKRRPEVALPAPANDVKTETA